MLIIILQYSLLIPRNAKSNFDLMLTGNLKKILSKIRAAKSEEEKDQAFEPIQEIITLVQFANDERDYGMGLELGLNLFCFGDPYLHSSVLALLPLAYELLGRPKFAQIVKVLIDCFCRVTPNAFS